MAADVTEIGGADRAVLWFTWPLARLTVTPQRASIVSVLGWARYERPEVERVFLYKRTWGPWGIRFETQKAQRRWQLGFVPRRGPRLLASLSALGWATEEQPQGRGNR